MVSKSKRIPRAAQSLPLAKAEGNVMLIAIVAMLVFLAGTAWVVGTAADKMSGRWNSTLANELTIEIDTSPDASQGNTPELRIQHVKEVLAQYNAVISVQTIDHTQLQNMLKPWIGDMSNYADLPLPVLLKVSLHPDHNLSFDEIAKQIMDKVQGVNVVAHYAWAGEVQEIARMVTLVAWGTIAIVAAISIFQMVFMARSRIAAFAPEIEILHTLGATDGFIAAEFEKQAFKLSFVGVLIGAIALLSVFGFFVHTLYPGLQLLAGVPADQIGKLNEWREEIWGTAAIPVIILFLNTFMCRVAVLSALRRLV